MIKQLVTAAALAGAAIVPAASASADPPVEEVFTDFFIAFPDFNVDKAVFINIEVVELCNWIETGFPGPPPVVDDEIPVRGVPTGQGAVVGKIDTDVYIEIWDFDDGADFSDPCTDLADQLANGDDPFAVGTGRFLGKTNDAFDSGTRGVAFGDRASAHLVGQDGSDYSYRYVFRGNEQCAFDDLGAPRCGVERSRLLER